MQYSTRIQKVQPSATLTINAKAQELKAQGQEILNLAAGEPDFQPPQHVLQAVHQAVDQGKTRYTAVPGMPDLLQAVADYFRCFYQIEAGPEMVTTCNGGKQALYNLFQVLLNHGDEVLIPAPYWVSYPEMVKLADGEPMIVPTAPENNFLLQLKDLQKSLSPKSKVLILNSPSNPTGCHYSQQDLDSILEFALDQGLFVISDEVYDQLVYPPAKASTAAGWITSHPEQVAVVNGLSKSFALTGWRIGFVLTDPGLCKLLNRLQGQSTSNICVLAQEAALAALQGSFDFLQEQRHFLAQRRDLALQQMESWSGVHCPRPDGAFYLFPRMEGCFKGQVSNSTQLCSYLLEEAGVATVPGIAFGDDRCLRFSYATDQGTLQKGLDLVESALQRL
ncbi:MAG: pyridoxal phosphate-dependent aminotransferase [Desulfohalobiaceae bacterium]